MVRRYKICFEYLGANFFGSQKQPDKRTVQGELEKALNTYIRTLKKDKISVIPSGRTDSKVSAKCQVAHFDCEVIQNIDNFLYHLNSILPPDLKVFELEEVKPDFHAQKDAKYKHYRYTILNDHVASVFNSNYLFYPYHKLDVDKINEILSYIVGYYDFSSFKTNNDNPYNDCTIYLARAKSEIVERRNFIYIDIVGNRFLYNMIRTIVGEILYILRNNLDSKVMQDVLNSRSRANAKDTASASGLCLEFVGYGNVQDYIKKLD